ncbi:MAG: ATP-binding protein [Planctomycetota bacterium]
MRSIRRRLMVTLSIGFAALIVVPALYVEGITRARVTDEFDAALLAEGRALLSLIAEDEEGFGEFEYVPECMPHFERKEKPDYFQIWLGDGTVIEDGRSGSVVAAGKQLPRWESLSTEPESKDIRLLDGRAGRAVQFAFLPKADGAKGKPAPGAPTLVIMVARGRERLDALIASARLAICGAGAVAMLLAALLVWWALATGLRPIHAIAAQVRELHADNLGAQVAAPEAPSELAPIVHQLNALLARLEASFERERRFTGHVAHELRTPIAELRSLAEVGGKWPEDLASTRRYFADVHEIAGRMERVVVDLLLLARCHAGVEKAQSGAVPLRQVVESQPGAGRVEIDVPADLVVDSDPGKLSLIVSNLLDNALSYAAPGGPVRCVAAARDSRFTLDVVNPAEPLTKEDLKNLAEPFWRKDRARSPEGHSGLGLSLVTALAGLLGLEVGFSQDGGGLFRARVSGRLWDPGKDPKVIQRFVAYPQAEHKEAP